MNGYATYQGHAARRRGGGVSKTVPQSGRHWLQACMKGHARRVTDRADKFRAACPLCITLLYSGQTFVHRLPFAAIEMSQGYVAAVSIW